MRPDRPRSGVTPTKGLVGLRGPAVPRPVVRAGQPLEGRSGAAHCRAGAGCERGPAWVHVFLGAGWRALSSRPPDPCHCPPINPRLPGHPPHRLHWCPAPADQYTGQPRRDAAMMVHCFAPFNAETPHTVLSKVCAPPAAVIFLICHEAPFYPDTQLKLACTTGALRGLGAGHGRAQGARVERSTGGAGRGGRVVRCCCVCCRLECACAAAKSLCRALQSACEAVQACSGATHRPHSPSSLRQQQRPRDFDLEPQSAPALQPPVGASPSRPSQNEPEQQLGGGPNTCTLALTNPDEPWQEFLTPPGLFYVRNHLPVPCCDNPEEYRRDRGRGIGIWRVRAGAEGEVGLAGSLPARG